MDNRDDEDGDSLWAYVTRTVKPLRRGDRAVPPPPPSPPAVPPEKPRAPLLERLLAARRPPAPPQHPGTGLDRASDRKLKRGQMAIEERLDLHGLSRDRAYESLCGFVAGAAARDRRCVLVITGKGRGDGPGILRTALPQWLAAPPLADAVLRFYPAQPRDGGDGAFYVLLRRRR